MAQTGCGHLGTEPELYTQLAMSSEVAYREAVREP
jgi:hypothetical protein